MKQSNKNLCIIPARGGSKRIPRKNIKDFLGKPIIAYVIEAAKNSGMFEEVMVSTDDREIAKVAEIYGAKVPFLRSAETSDDFTPLKDVIEEVKQHYLRNYSKSFDYICCALPTGVFINETLLKNTFELMINQDFDSVRPVVPFSYPIQRAFKLNENHQVEMFFPEYQYTRSQDLEQAYHDAGMFYWMKYDQGLSGTHRGGYIISEQLAQDIDTEEDWKMAELKYKLVNLK